MSNAIAVTVQQRLFLQNQPFTTLLSVTSAASSCLLNRQRELARMPFGVPACVRACASLCLCMPQAQACLCMCEAGDEAGEGACVRGENSAGHKGCRKVQQWEGGEGKKWRSSRAGGGGCVEGSGGRGEGGLADYPLHLAQLCRPTHSHQSGTPICPRLSQPLSTPHVTPYILLFMLNNWQFCFTCSAFARTRKCDSKQGMTQRGAARFLDFIMAPC